MTSPVNTSGFAVTPADVVNAATDVLDGITSGRLSAADVQTRAVEEMRRMFGVIGAGASDPLWSVHGDVCRQFLAAGGLSADELAEWLAVQRRREVGGS